MQSPKLKFGNLEAEDVQWQHRYGSFALAVEPLYFILTCPGTPGQDAGPPGGDPNQLL